MRTYKDFTEIKKLYKEDAKQHYKNNMQYFEKLPANEWIENWYVNDTLTKRELKQPLKTQKRIYKDKERKKMEKRINDFFAQCDTIAKTEPAHFIKIEINWTQSKTWGWNPSAEVWAGSYTTGHASGCGYDKRSAAVAQALNKQNSVLNRLYNFYEMQLRKNKTSQDKSIRTLIEYGAGYVKPYFEGGVGYECHKRIFDKLGAKINIWRDGKTWDFMQIEF